MQKSKIELLIDLIRLAFVQSEVKVTEPELEKVALVVYDSMSNPGRNFHNVHHVFDVAKSLNGVSILAAVFHDVIYYQVDNGFRFSIEKFIYEHIEKKDDQFFVKEVNKAIYKEMQLIFGVHPGSTLNVFNGLNEFLSAAIAVRELENLIPHTHLLKIIGLIESTIPFRKDPITVLVERFNKKSFPKEEMQDLTNRAVDFSNQDVFNFADEKPSHFLNNTWNLISETNYSLRRDIDNYTIVEYRVALFKTYMFFKYLEPSNVFTRYKDYPAEKEWEKLNNGANSNVTIARKYLAIQLVSAATIEAIAELTGGNAPMSLFMGDVRRRDQKLTRMEDHLGEVAKPKSGLNKHLVNLLKDGRAQESSFDMKASPIGAFIYKSLGEEKVEELFSVAENYFDKKFTANVIIENYPKDIIKKIILACAKITSTRRTELHKLADSL